MSNTPTASDDDWLKRVRSRWLSPRRKRFWAIALVVAYTLFGFFAVPPLLNSATVDTLRDQTGREATLGKIRFNPYVLSLEVEDFALRDTDGERLAAFDRLFVNFQLSSLFRWAWTFREFRLDGLYVLLERFAPGDSRLGRLLDDVAERAEPEPPGEQAGSLPRLLVHDLGLGEGVIHFRDDVPAEPVDLEFGPVTVSVRELNTLPDRLGQQAVQIGLPGDAAVSWQGTLALAPLQSEGSLSVEGTHLEQTTTYLKALLPLESLQATLSTRMQYRVNEAPDGGLNVELDGLDVAVTDIAATGLTPTSEFLAVQRLELSDGNLRYPENRLRFSSVRVTGPSLETWIDETGAPSLLQLVPAEASPSAPAQSPRPDNAGGGSERAWQLEVDDFALTGGQVVFSDRSIEPQAGVDVQAIELSLRDVSNADGARMPASLSARLAAGGAIGFEGSLVALPTVEASGQLTLSDIPLSLAQPYVQQSANVRIEQGALSTSAEVTLRADETVAVAGDLTVTELAVNDGVLDRPLVGWRRFSTDRFEADTAKTQLRLSRLIFEQPFGRLVINEDQTTNLTDLVREDAAASDAQPGDGGSVSAADEPEPAPDPADGTAARTDGAPAHGVVIGGIEVRQGRLDFSDLSLPLPFGTEIHELGGTISTIDTASAEPANVRLEGQVDDYGLARIDGALNLLDPVRSTNITMEFRNLLMSNLSPYTVQFAGREIAEGKLDLDLQYVIDGGLMKGQNDIVMSDLVLGDKVDHPDAASLPLGLAVALLKDSNGVIDIELPVEGDVNDPQFRIGGVVWQAFVGLITKIVSAPFRLLGGLVGAEDENLGQFQFLAGRADLTPPEMERIGLLQEALRKRPELAIEVSGAYAPEIDVPALQYDRLRGAVLARVGQEAAPDGQEITMLDEQLRSVLEALFTERFPETPLDAVKAEHSAPPPDDPEDVPVLDGPAYAADLRDRLLDAVEISQSDLAALANERAGAIQAAFLASGEFPVDRIQVADPKETESEDEEWVAVELGVAVE